MVRLTGSDLDQNIDDINVGLRIEIRAGRVHRAFRTAPRVGWRHIRDTVGAIFGSHRREWIRRTDVEFSQRNGMTAERLNSREREPGRGFQDQRRIFYRVFPTRKRWQGSGEPDLSKIRGEAFSTSRVAKGLETGGVFRAKGSRWIAIPIGITLDSLGRPKSKWYSPRAYRRASARNELVALKIRGRYPKLYQQKGGGSRVAAQKEGALSLLSDRPSGRRRSGSRILIPAYQLVPRVTRRPLLGFIRTWNELESDRQRRFNEAADRILKDIDRGLTS